MKKCLLLFAIFAIVSTIICSCKIKTTDKNGGIASPPPVTDTGFFGNGKQFYFVAGEGVSLQNKIDNIYSHVNQATGEFPIFITSSDKGGEYEIVFGRSDRKISKKAYEMLDRYYSGIPNESVWAIYLSGGSICVTFDTNQAMMRAIAYFEDNLLNEALGTKEGVLAHESFDVYEKAREEREEKHTEAFNKLESQIGVEAVEALKDLFGLYDEGLYLWLANLWCPDVGGFYYSNSGRDTEGFLPDIESTKQALAFITKSGMVSEYESANYSEALLRDYPEIAEKVLNFAVGLQAEDGYFYHPQWKDSPSTSRISRDLNSARGIITELGGTANYPYPEDSFDSSDEDALVPMSALTGRLGGSSVLSVSKVIATSVPAYLLSLDKWAAYIDSLGIDKGNSYPGGNTLVSQKRMIKAAGQEYCDYLINYLNSKQYDNGTWEREISYGALDGLMKISGLYEHFDVPLPRAKAAAESCITRTIDTTPKATGKTHVCDVYNTWYALAAVIRMADKSLKNEIRQSVKENFPEMIDSTCQKMSMYRKDDGSFSWYEDESHYTSQGSVVAVPRTNEGDVNASTIASSGLLGWVFDCIGVKDVPLFYAADFEIFMNVILNAGSIVKDEAPDPEAITFDDIDVLHNPTENGIVSSPDDMIEIAVRDKEMVNGEYKWVDSEVVSSPAPMAKGDNAVKFEVKTNSCTCTDEPCTCKTRAERASVLFSKTQNGTILGNAYIAEFDFYLGEWGSDNIISQIGFTESTSGGYSMQFNLRTYTAADGKNYIRLEDYYPGLDGSKNTSLVEGIPAEEWVRFRFELYKTEQLFTDDKSGEVKQYLANVCKIYVNGEYVAESDSAPLDDDGETTNKHVNGFSISGYRHVPSVIYVDNVLVYRTNTDFVSEEDAGNGVLDNIAVDKSKTVADFEDGRPITYYLRNTLLPGYIKYAVEEIAGRKALHVVKNAIPSSSQMHTQANLINPTDSGECYTYETKIYYDSSKMVSGKYVSQLSVNAASSLSFIGFNLKFYGTYVEVQHNKNYIDGSDEKSSVSVKDINGKALHLPVDEWFTFKLEFYRAEIPSESMVKIYIGDANGENMALSAEFNGYMTEKTDDITRFLFTHYRATENISVYLDDISFTRSNKEFVSEIPEEPVSPPPATPDTPEESSPIETFDKLTSLKGDGTDSDVKFAKKSPGNANLGLLQEGDEISIAQDPADAANKVLMFRDGSTSAYTALCLNTKSNVTNGISVFETKIYVASEGFTGSSSYVAQFAFSKGFTTKGKTVNFRTKDDGRSVYLAVDDKTDAELEFSGSNVTFSTDEWHVMRLEYHNSLDTESSCIKVYIDGLYAGKITSGVTADDVNGFLWWGYSSGLSTIYFDDMSYTEKAMPTE